MASGYISIVLKTLSEFLGNTMTHSAFVLMAFYKHLRKEEELVAHSELVHRHCSPVVPNLIVCQNHLENFNTHTYAHTDFVDLR